MKVIKNNSGMTLVEIIMSIGLMGLVGLGIANLSKTNSKQIKNTTQNVTINKAATQLQEAISKIENCNLILPTPNAPDINQVRILAGANAAGALEDATIITNATSIVPIIPSIAGNSTQTFPVEIVVNFQKSFGNSQTSATRIVKAQLVYINSTAASAVPVFSGCAEYEELAKKSTFKFNCENIGGKFIDASPYSCDVSSIDTNSYFARKIRKDLCTKLFSKNDDSAYDDNNPAVTKCLDFMIEDNSILTASNMDANSISLNNNKRTTFNQTNCDAPNSFIKAVNIDGSVSCISVDFCIPGSPSCPNPVIPGSLKHCQTGCNCSATTQAENGAGPGATYKGVKNLCPATRTNDPKCIPKVPSYLPSGGTWDGSQYVNDFDCKGLNCRYKDYFNHTGTNSYSTTSTITISQHNNLSQAGNCSVTQTQNVVAGLCERFTNTTMTFIASRSSGHSLGSFAGFTSSDVQTESAPNGTSCGGTGYCKSGACAEDGVCASSHYNCNQGYAINTSENASEYSWQCQGINGGTTVSCSEVKPPPSCTEGEERWIGAGSCPNCGGYPKITCELDEVQECSGGNWVFKYCHRICIPDSTYNCP